MLATFYIVDSCARLRADRLHRRERKRTWATRLQAWLSKARYRPAVQRLSGLTYCLCESSLRLKSGTQALAVSCMCLCASCVSNDCVFLVVS